MGRSPGWPDNMYSALAGFVEPGESFEEAARREIFEEANIQVGRVRYLESQPWPFPSSLMIGCIAEAQTREIRIDTAGNRGCALVQSIDTTRRTGRGHQ